MPLTLKIGNQFNKFEQNRLTLPEGKIWFDQNIKFDTIDQEIELNDGDFNYKFKLISANKSKIVIQMKEIVISTGTNMGNKLLTFFVEDSNKDFLNLSANDRIIFTSNSLGQNTTYEVFKSIKSGTEITITVNNEKGEFDGPLFKLI